MRVFMWFLVLTVGQGALFEGALAQQRRLVTRPPEELLAAYARDAEAGRGFSEASMDLFGVVLGTVNYRHSSEAVLVGLEDLALHGSSSRQRARAALALSEAGSEGVVKPRAGTAARLEKLYGKSSDLAVRAAIVSGLSASVERPVALPFLEAVAVRDSEDFPGSSLAAMTAIAAHGDQGSAVLKRLHATKKVHEPHARQWLDLIAQKGYRIR